MRSISVFLPTYNEEANIAETVTKASDYLKSKFSDYEILVVNDGSQDRTAEVVAGLQKEIKNLKIVSHPKNLGYAQALRTGFKSTGKDLIFYTDSDGQFDITELDKFLPLLDQYDVITGFRIKRQDALMRIWMGKIYNLVYRFLFRLKVRDIDCAFKLFKKEIFRGWSFVPSIRTGVVNAEIYLKARRRGFKIAEVPVRHLPRLKGATSNEIGGKQGKIFAFVKPRVYWDFLHDTIALCLNLIKQK